ncbi:response regulator transcription factor [Clostridium estertheticum]|uniref:response regulator transcription factor n=1 Tax=Clostridium estertheticum TaxID=238834 RepID=UPI0013E94A0D|nr:response regulator transcription factor [Clostridium estertheticum]MBZ9685525.1 response regulator transcription factor [Clostridium estertheticum]
MKIIIVDDDGLIRDSLKLLIELEEDMEVIGTAKNGMEAFELCKANNPDIVLMDIRMPVMDGVLGTKLIKENFHDIKVVLLTTFKDDEYIREAVMNGAEGYILKNQSSDSIIESLRTVFKGNVVFEKDIISSIKGMLKEENKKEPSHFNLSEREFEILALISDGLSNKEIAEKLFLGEGTVRNYITNVLGKLWLRDRTQLAIFYLKNF